jgi:hypothetical protein
MQFVSRHYLDDPGGPKMHLHFFGRARKQVHQIRGQHISLFPKGHPVYDGHLKPIADADLPRLRTAIAETLRETMCEWPSVGAKHCSRHLYMGVPGGCDIHRSAYSISPEALLRVGEHRKRIPIVLQMMA